MGSTASSGSGGDVELTPAEAELVELFYALATVNLRGHPAGRVRPVDLDDPRTRRLLEYGWLVATDRPTADDGRS